MITSARLPHQTHHISCPESRHGCSTWISGMATFLWWAAPPLGIWALGRQLAASQHGWPSRGVPDGRSASPPTLAVQRSWIERHAVTDCARRSAEVPEAADAAQPVTAPAEVPIEVPEVADAAPPAKAPAEAAIEIPATPTEPQAGGPEGAGDRRPRAPGLSQASSLATATPRRCARMVQEPRTFVALAFDRGGARPRPRPVRGLRTGLGSALARRRS